MTYPGVFRKWTNFCQIGLLHFMLVVTVFLLSHRTRAQPRVLDSSLHHLRISNQLEWDEFANEAPKKELSISFDIKNKTEHTLALVQYDVKQDWNVLVNGQKIGSLITDGNKMRVYFKLKPEIVRAGENTLTIGVETDVPDDIIISDITLDERPVEKVLTEATVDIQVIDKKTRHSVPSRITIVDRNKVLQSTGTPPVDSLAIRPGYIYSATGKISLQVPRGEYMIYAGRGFEYSVDSAVVVIKAGQHLRKDLFIQQEVNTDGWVSSDTHIHTLTNSGHGDATDVERALTIAGEGVELPVITEHNKIVDFSIAAKKAGVDSFFTIVTGNEMTTPVGHFNLFPLSAGDTPADHRVKTWHDVSKNLPDTSKTAVVLNHGRDIHNGFRPFDPKRHISTAGLSLDHWTLPANAMEIINSGALQDDPMRLVHDWFGLLNAGISLTPAGSSDSHDVSRYLVGQARTYIKSGDRDIARINVAESAKNFKEGKVMVSFGLLPKIIVNKKYGPGDHVLLSKNTIVNVEVAGPGWINAERVTLYANGIKVREEKIKNGKAAGTKWKGEWTLTNQKHDAFLVVIAEGSGDHLPYWPIVKPYQPVSTAWIPYTMGVSGAIWIDADGDGKISTAQAYADSLVTRFGQDLKGLFKAMAVYDEGIAIQAAAQLHKSGTDISSAVFSGALSKASKNVRQGFRKFIDESKQSK